MLFIGVLVKVEKNASCKPTIFHR